MIKNPDGKLKKSYRRYSGMIRRCYSPSSTTFKFYGQRGITVCERWRERRGKGYENFMADMGECPEGLTLDRINNNGNYEPANCRWATWAEQAKNKRPRTPTNLNSLRQKSIRAGIPYHVVYQRIRFLKWPEDKALSTPVAPRGKVSFFDLQIADEKINPPEPISAARFKRGYQPEPWQKKVPKNCQSF